jgi:hypothetical protein
MLIIGCDFHAGFQVLAIFDNRIGVSTKKRLEHPQEAVSFYRELLEQGERVRVGMEAGPPCQWFRRLLSECGHELWIGDAARIRAAAVGKKKTDREDAKLMLQRLGHISKQGSSLMRFLLVEAGADGREERRRAEAGLPTLVGAQRQQGRGQGDGGATAGSEVVLDAP